MSNWVIFSDGTKNFQFKCEACDDHEKHKVTSGKCERISFHHGALKMRTIRVDFTSLDLSSFPASASEDPILAAHPASLLTHSPGPCVLRLSRMADILQRLPGGIRKLLQEFAGLLPAAARF
jgi:hypothetical protein